MAFLGLGAWRTGDQAADRRWETEFLLWPPDVFAAAAVLVRDSGTYLEAPSIGLHAPTNGADEIAAVFKTTASEWTERVISLAETWRRLIPRHDEPAQERERLWSRLPSEIREWYQLLRTNASTPIASLRQHAGCWTAAFALMAVADQACRGLGLLGDIATADSADDYLYLRSLRQLLEQQKGRVMATDGAEHAGAEDWNWRDVSTLCRKVHPSRACVLPKLRTPQRGITIRSVTHHLSLHTRSEVRPCWWVVTPGDGQGEVRQHRDRDTKPRTYNILIVPHPFEVMPRQFRPLSRQTLSGLTGRLAAGNGFFEFHHGDSEEAQRGIAVDLMRDVTDCIDEAQQRFGPIDGVVLPEASMSMYQFGECFGDKLPGGVRFMVCGVYEPPRGGALGRNYAILRFREAELDGEKRTHPAPPGEPIFDVRQHKHHRWALDDRQIRTYGVASALHPTMTWWEAIDIPPRQIGFATFGEFCAASVLICEDLARPDPIAESIRAVGPNLVIGLLQDGPQLAGRWAARYAVALADDPGCSVLTVTSLGMAKLSRPGHSSSDSPDRTIALWRDAQGDTREIVLPKGAQVMVIALSESTVEENTADGRKDGLAAGSLHFGGAHGVYIKEPKALKEPRL